MSLAEASLLIRDYQQHPKSSVTHMAFLAKLQQRIDAICSTQRGWLKTGMVAERLLANTEKPPITQEDICAEALNAHIQTIGFTWIAVLELLREVNIEIDDKKSTAEADYLDLLALIKARLVDVYNHLYMHDYIVAEKVVLPRNEAMFFSAKSKKIKQLIDLGGRIIPFAQEYDPLVGETAEGSCLGYTFQWGDEIQPLGYALKLAREDKEMLEKQFGQMREIMKRSSFKETLTNLLKHEKYHYDTDLMPAVENLINRMSHEKLYNLDLVFSRSDIHSMGIRFIPSTGEIEFFDANLGLVVFKDPGIFKYWLADHLCDYYHEVMRKGGWLTIYEIGKQPAHSRASIPELAMGGNAADFAVKQLETLKSLRTIPALFEPEAKETKSKQKRFWFFRSALKHPEAIEFMPSIKPD